MGKQIRFYKAQVVHIPIYVSETLVLTKRQKYDTSFCNC